MDVYRGPSVNPDLSVALMNQYTAYLGWCGHMGVLPREEAQEAQERMSRVDQHLRDISTIPISAASICIQMAATMGTGAVRLASESLEAARLNGIGEVAEASRRLDALVAEVTPWGWLMRSHDTQAQE